MLGMQQIPISKFKATCLGVLETVRKTRKPVLVTRFGTPIAEVVPPSMPDKPKHWIGSLAGTAVIQGDIISPTTDDQDWEALR